MSGHAFPKCACLVMQKGATQLISDALTHQFAEDVFVSEKEENSRA